MKKINKKELIIYTIMFVITCAIFTPLLIGHYSTDTYNISNVGYQNYAIHWSLIDGRIFMAILGLIASKINISIEAYTFITLFSAIIISNLAMITLSKIIKKYKKPENIIQEIIILIIGYITIFNFMYLENMYFVESTVMATSVLLYIISADILVEKNKNYIIKSIILTSLGIMCYQGTVGLFFAYVTLFTILKNKNNEKQIIIDLIKSGIIALISVSIDILSVKVIENLIGQKQTRLGKISDVFRNITIIIASLPNVLQWTCNLFPRNLLIIYLGLLISIILIYTIKNKEYKNDIVAKFVLITLITIAGSCVTYLLALTSFYTGRLRNALGALIGILFIFIYVETDLLQKKNKLGIITFITLISYLIINILNYESIMIQHKEVNKLERIESQEIEQYIEEYENNTENKVTNIALIVIRDNLEKAFLPNAKNKTSFTHNAIRTSWAADGAINFYTNRNLKTVTLTQEEKQNYMENNNTEKGYKCIGDTLYLNVYMY